MQSLITMVLFARVPCPRVQQRADKNKRQPSGLAVTHFRSQMWEFSTAGVRERLGTTWQEGWGL